MVEENRKQGSDEDTRQERERSHSRGCNDFPHQGAPRGAWEARRGRAPAVWGNEKA